MSRRVALKGNPIDLFHPHLLAPENSVYCGQADIINALKVDIIGNDFISDLPESDEVVSRTISTMRVSCAAVNMATLPPLCGILSTLKKETCVVN